MTRELCCAPLLLVLSAILAFGQEATSIRAERKLHISRANAPPVLADYLSGAFPPEAMPITGFLQRNPDDAKPVSRNTTAWLSYDDENIYAIFICKAEPGELRARFSKRDDIAADDAVGIFLDRTKSTMPGVPP